MHSGRPTVRSRKPNNYNVQQRVGNGTECTGNSRFKNQVIYNQPTDWPTNQPNYQQPTKPSRPNLLFSNTLVFLSCFCPHCLSVAAASSSSSSSLGNRLPFETDDKNDNFTFRKCFFFREKVCELFVVIDATQTSMSVGLRASNVASAPVKFTLNRAAISTPAPVESYLDSTARDQFARGSSLPVQSCAIFKETNAEYGRICAAGNAEVTVLPS